MLITTSVIFTASVFASTDAEKEKPDPTQMVGTITNKVDFQNHYDAVVRNRINCQREDNEKRAHKITKPLIKENRLREKQEAQKKLQKEEMHTETLIQEKIEFTTSCAGAKSQSGIVADYTHFATQNWGNPCLQVFNTWKERGQKTKRGIATIDGYYLVATKPKFGAVGDRINIILEDGTKIKAIQADVKGNEHNNDWGHNFGKGISLVEWELDNSRYSSPDLTNWQGKNVKSIENLGAYVNK